MINLSLGQFIYGDLDTIEEMNEGINNVTREDILDIANKLSLVMEYFLTKGE